MDHPLLLTIAALLFSLAAIERLAAHALRAKQDAWRAHYAAIPACATVTAELRWNEGNWVTAFVDPRCDTGGALRLVAQRPLTPREQAVCLHWLRAEGFAEPAACRRRNPNF